MPGSRLSRLRPEGGRLLAGALASAAGASLWLLWIHEHDNTGIRAPWTGLTLGAAAAAYAVAGIVGRGLTALAVTALTAATAVLLWAGLQDPVPEGFRESCDPGCIPLGSAVAFFGAEACALTLVGILTRRSVSFLRRRLPRLRGSGEAGAA